MIRLDRNGKKQIAETDYAARARITHTRIIQGKHKRKLRKPAKWNYPAGAEMRYRVFMRRLVEKWREQVKNMLPHLERIVGERDLEHKTDAWTNSLDNVLATFKMGLDDATNPHVVNSTLLEIGKQTSNFNEDEWHKIIKGVLGVDVYTPERFLKSHIESFVKENSTLITKLKEETYHDCSRILTSGIRNGDRVEQLRKDLLSDSDLEPGRFRTVETRAELIARDQVGKLNGELTLNRQTGLGITEYIWRTVKDERVRGDPAGLYPNARPSHYDREGVKYSWDDPPEGGHPGEAIQCRCFAEPVFDDEEFAPEEIEAPEFVSPKTITELRTVEKTLIPEPAVAAPAAEITETTESIKSRELISEFKENYISRFGNISKTYEDSAAVKNTATTAIELHKDALKAEPILRDVVGKAAKDVGGEAYFGLGDKFAVKSMESLVEKIEVRGKLAENITDGVRGTLVVKDLKNLKRAVSSLKTQIENAGGRILQIDDKYANPLMSGYVGVHVDAVFELPGGKIIRSEIQVHNDDMTVKELSERLYQQFRTQKITEETMNRSREIYAPFMKKNLR